MSSTITIYTPQTKYLSTTEKEIWFLKREEIDSYDSELIGEAAAENTFNKTTIDIGDIVRVENKIRTSGDKQIPEYYMYTTSGWEKYDDDVIQLIKYLL